MPRGKKHDYQPELAEATIDAPLGRTHAGNVITKNVPKMILLSGPDEGTAFGTDGFRLRREPSEDEDAFRIRALQSAARESRAWVTFFRRLSFSNIDSALAQNEV